MATLSRGQSFGASETVTNTKLHNLVDAATISEIVNADISASAAIVDTKLADITTGGKVRGISLLNLASTPVGAGLMPVANIPLLSLSSIPAAQLINLASIPTNQGRFNYQALVASLASGALTYYDGASSLLGRTLLPHDHVVSSLASGSLPVYNGVTNYVGKTPSEVVPILSNQLFSYTGFYASLVTGGTNMGEVIGNTMRDGATPPKFRYLMTEQASFLTAMTWKYKHLQGISTVTVYIFASSQGGEGATPQALCDIGGQNVTINIDGGGTPAWYSGAINVSGLTPGTVYDVTFQLKAGQGDFVLAAYNIQGIGS